MLKPLGAQGTFTSGEVIYKFKAPIFGKYTISLKADNIDTDLELFVLSHCCPGEFVSIENEEGSIGNRFLENSSRCFEFCKRGSTSSNGIELESMLIEENYEITIIVDGFLGAEGSFSIEVICDTDIPLCGQAEFLTCGAKEEGDLRQENSNFNRHHYSHCANYSPNLPFDGGDKTYRFTKSDRSDVVTIEMKHDQSTNLTMHIMSCDFTTDPSTICIGKGSNVPNNNHPTGERWTDNGTLDAGDYYIVVDASKPSREAPFAISIKCENECIDLSDRIDFDRNILCYPFSVYGLRNAYVFVFTPGNGPNEMKFADLSSVIWFLDDEEIGRGQEFLYSPSIDEGTVCIEWNATIEGREICYRFCKKVDFYPNTFCNKNLIQPIFIGSQDEVENGNYRYEFRNSLNSNQRFEKWEIFNRDHPSELLYESNNSLFVAPVINTTADNACYRICISYLEDGMYKVCCLDLCLRNPYNCNSEILITCESPQEGYNIDHITDEDIEILYWVDGSGNILRDIGNNPNIEGYVPRQGDDRFIYAYYLDCRSDDQDIAESCSMNVCCYELPPCPEKCYDNCCSDRKWLEEFVDSMLQIQCIQVFPSECPYDHIKIYQCQWNGRCVYNVRNDNPQVFDDEGGSVMDCEGNILFEYGFFANINVDLFNQLGDCNLIWTSSHRDISICPSDCIETCIDFDAFDKNISITSQSDDWTVSNCTSDASGALIVEKFDKALLEINGEDITSVIYNIGVSDNAELSFQIYVEEGELGLFHILGSSGIVYKIDFNTGLFAGGIIESRNDNTLSFELPNSEDVTRFEFKVRMKEGVSEFFINERPVGILKEDDVFSAVEFCGVAGTYFIHDMCVNTCDQKCYERCCETDDKTWYKEVLSSLESFCSDNMECNAIVTQAQYEEECVFILPNDPCSITGSYVVVDCNGQRIFTFGGLFDFNREKANLLMNQHVVWDCVNGPNAECSEKSQKKMKQYQPLPKEVLQAVVEEGEVVISPNPFVDNFDFSFQSESNYKAEFRLYNIQGSLVYSRGIDVLDGENTFSIDLDNSVSNGLLIYEVSSPEAIRRGKVLKVN